MGSKPYNSDKRSASRIYRDTYCAACGEAIGSYPFYQVTGANGMKYRVCVDKRDICLKKWEASQKEAASE